MFVSRDSRSGFYLRESRYTFLEQTPVIPSACETVGAAVRSPVRGAHTELLFAAGA